MQKTGPNSWIESSWTNETQNNYNINQMISRMFNEMRLLYNFGKILSFET